MAEDQQRRRGRRRHRPEHPVGPPQPPFRQPRVRLGPTEVVSADELEAIHEASLRVLAEVGVDFLDAESRRLLAAAGAEVDDDRVRFDPDLVLELIATCPSTFTLHARNPDHSLTVGGDHLAFGSVASPPNYVGLDGVRRPGDRDGYQQLLRLCQQLHSIHFVAGYPVEPIDLHPSVRHLHAAHDALTLTDKVIHSYSLGGGRNLDVLELVRIARGVTLEQLDREPSLFSVINASSPLRIDGPMLEGVRELSAANQVIVFTPFTLAGAMAPVTLAGALVQQNAEALAGLAFTQVVRPGAPVVYGGFTSNVDMQSGAPAFGTPEYVRAAMIGGQLARRYGVPYRSSNACAANAVDAQAGYESVFSLWGAVMGGANVVMHGAGWMEGGLHASLSKMVLDADLLGMVATMLEPVPVDDASLAVDAIAEVGPGGHFFGVEHTQARYRDAFHRPMVSDWRNWETWVEAGGPRAEERATALARQLLADHTPPSMADDARAELDDLVARRVAEGGSPTD